MFLVLQNDKLGYTAATYLFFGDYSELCRLYGDSTNKTIIETIKAQHNGFWEENDRIEVIEHLEINPVFHNYKLQVALLVWLFKMHGVGV